MAHTVEFERCVDFLARMIEKYGSELLQELNGLPKEDKAEDNCQQEQQQNTLGNDTGEHRCWLSFFLRDICAFYLY